MSTILLDTTSEDAVSESLSRILNVRYELINHYIVKNAHKINKGNVNDVDLQGFFQFLIKNSKDNVNTEINISHVTISHLTPRFNFHSITKEPLYNLTNALTKDTDLSAFLQEKNLKFISKKGIVKVKYNEEEINWAEFSSPTAKMIINRLEGNRVWSTRDNCINGFLFSGKIYRNRNVKHILKIPEIISNIFSMLNMYEEKNEYMKNSTPFIIIFKVRITDIVFDGSNGDDEINTKEMLVCNCLYYLSLQKLGFWSCDDNPMIRLDDNIDINKDNIEHIFEVNVDEDKLIQRESDFD